MVATDIITLMHLKDKFATIKMSPTDKMMAHVHNYEMLLQQMTAAGLVVD